MKKLVLFLLIAFSSLLLADRGLSFIFDFLYERTKTGQTGGKINYYISLSPPPPMLIMGNSRSLYQIIPDSFHTEGFNLSHAGMGPAFQTALLDILKEHKKLPYVILLHIEPYEFTHNHPQRDVQNLKYYYGRNKVATQYISELSLYEDFKFNFELYRYNGRVVSLVKNYLQTLHSGASGNGYEMIAATPSDSMNTIYSFTKIQHSDEPPVDHGQLSKLTRYISITREKNIRLICFTSPVFKGINQYTIATSTLDSLFAKNNIEYINYIREPIEYLNMHPELWRDAYHLNHNGARIQSDSLALQVKKIMLQR